MGELPSNGGVHDTFTRPPLTLSVATTLVGGCGNSMTSSLAERLSLPPSDSTRHTLIKMLRTCSMRKVLSAAILILDESDRDEHDIEVQQSN
ncbi:hypothetical protein DERP_009144 [Dermatophagoides pteronyssinus]|uniref:Uncharacterized protein n=1 Tax=Dermatophagoides pteronyssinus TaxID=6956 RepID=A0ABQ8JQW4_DERPT|nr:hypothetical protein DERP_009144 [Dermatophagoides pteronyssinus]